MVRIETHINNQKHLLYHHHIVGCQKIKDVEDKQQLANIFLEDLNKYGAAKISDIPNFEELVLRDSAAKITYIAEVINSYKDYSNAIRNAISVKIGSFLGKEYKKKNNITLDKYLIVIVNKINKTIIERYSEVLKNCECNICKIGLFKKPDINMKVRKLDHCCKTEIELYIIKRQYSCFSARHLEKLIKVSKNIDNRIFKKFKSSTFTSYNFQELFSSNLCRNLLNGLALGDYQNIENFTSFTENNEDTISWLQFDISKENIKWLDGDSFFMTINNDRFIECRLYGIDSPEISTGVACYSYNDLRNETQTKRNGKLEYKFFPGIEAYKFVQRLTEESENIVVLLEPNPKMDSRRLARVLFDSKDYGTLSLKYGLSFPYPAFCNDKNYIKLAADARKKN